MGCARKRINRSVVAISSSILMSVALSGCATIDLSDVTRPSSLTKSTAQPELNVVQRAAMTLSAVFRDRGFVPDKSRKRLQSAASVLLNGLEEKHIVEAGGHETHEAVIFTASDIVFARSHVDRTVAAAEVYLDVAASNRDVREELASLEKALIASTKAQAVFDKAFEDTSSSDLVAYKASVANLRVVTNEFGARVRLQDVQAMSARGAAEDS